MYRCNYWNPLPQAGARSLDQILSGSGCNFNFFSNSFSIKDKKSILPFYLLMPGDRKKMDSYLFRGYQRELKQKQLFRIFELIEWILSYNNCYTMRAPRIHIRLLRERISCVWFIWKWNLLLPLSYNICNIRMKISYTKCNNYYGTEVEHFIDCNFPLQDYHWVQLLILLSQFIYNLKVLSNTNTNLKRGKCLNTAQIFFPWL